MAEKTAKYQLIVAIILAFVTIGNILYTYASRPTAELKETVKLHSVEIQDLQQGRTENKTNIDNLRAQIKTDSDNNRSDHIRILDKLDDILKKESK